VSVLPPDRLPDRVAAAANDQVIRNFPSPSQRDWRPLGAALAVATTYYAGAKIGLALTPSPFPLSILWPPNALLFAALLLAPMRWWWMLLLGALPAHLLAELQGGIPATMVASWFVSNVSEALLGALFVRWLSGPSPGLGTVRGVVVFCCGAALGPLLSSFLDAGLVKLAGWGVSDYWTLWRVRLLSNLLATLTFAPVVITWAAADPMRLRDLGRARWVEGATLTVGLLAVSIVAFDAGMWNPESSPSMVYLPVPFLVWAAMRFGPSLTSASFTIVAFLVIWGAGHGRGPFLHAVTHEDALPVQLFLITIAVPLLLLAALTEERRHAMRDLRASEELFSTAFMSSPDAVAVSRRSDERIIEANDRWLDLLGYGRGQLATGSVEPLSSHVNAADREKVRALTRDLPNVRDAEVTLRDCQGELRQVLVSITAVGVRDQDCVLCIVRDVTAQRRAEQEAREQRQQLTHLSRVASLADFSSSLAHELNQPLTAILSNAQAALRFLAREPVNLPEIRSILGEIADADKRAGLLIHHLRLLMKKGDEEFVRIDLNQLVKDVLDFAHGEFVTRNVQVCASFSPDLPQINGDAVQLRQLVLNLVSNACEAMQQQERRERQLGVTTLHGRDGVLLVVTDTGPGIAADKLDRIFEPFFTTKENGLGLGLSICRKIARAHGGTLVAEDRNGDGANLRLVLPPAQTPVLPPPLWARME
jgi:PAS domain S-box-containing protein